MDSDSEPKLLSLISRLMQVYNTADSDSALDSEGAALIIKIISLISSMDLDLQPKPESKLMSLAAQAISVFTSMDLEYQPTPLVTLISLISQKISLDSESEPEPKSDRDFMFLVGRTIVVSPAPELISLIHQILSLVISMDPKWKNLISLCPQVQVKWEEGSFHVLDEVLLRSSTMWECLPKYWEEFRSKGEVATHFFCRGCNGEDHEEYEKAPVEIKHPLHRKHSLQLVNSDWSGTKKCCYCCDVRLKDIFYCCVACNYAMNVTCAVKPPVLSIDHRKWHEHDLVVFPRKASLTCDLCGLDDSSCPFYICGPCDFVVHQSCISLPRVIRISRHTHRISFTPSFNKGDRSCGVCRKEINNDYGGYSCITKGCSYAAHSRCATQSNVWDGKDLENVPEEVEEEVKPPFVRISSGIIQHFMHEPHHMRLNEDTNREYDEDKQCQACITPIYSGNFYSCMQCDFILHQDCANLSRKIHHPIHPHLLTLVGGYEGVMKYHQDRCSGCLCICKAGFYYECGAKGCDFKLHVQCGTISEPLVHGSHTHPLFLTSKPEEKRECSVCQDSLWSGSWGGYDETFNCIECDFAMCFRCATLPQKVRYKHDKHMLILSYGKEISNTMTYWCEVCEKQVDQRTRFYRCDENCCVTLHVGCLFGDEFYVKPGSSWFFRDRQEDVLPNKHCMSRPICFYCEKRCPHNIVFQWCEILFCSYRCVIEFCYVVNG